MSKCNSCYHKKICIDSANYKTAESCKHYVSTYDIAEVVRCKDCKYCRTKECATMIEDDLGYLMFIETDYDYCSWGRRMDGGENGKN